MEKQRLEDERRYKQLEAENDKLKNEVKEMAALGGKGGKKPTSEIDQAKDHFFHKNIEVETFIN